MSHLLKLNDKVSYKVYHKPDKLDYDGFFCTDSMSKSEAKERLNFIKSQPNNLEAYLVKETVQREIIE